MVSGSSPLQPINISVHVKYACVFLERLCTEILVGLLQEIHYDVDSVS